MKKTLLIIYAACCSYYGFSQSNKKPTREDLLSELSEPACKCVDSIITYDRSKNQVAEDIHKCIDAQASAYQLGVKFLDVDSLEKLATEVKGKKQINISLNINKNSDEYKEYYYEMERYMMDHCKAVKAKIGTNDKTGEKSYSSNKEAMGYYNKGLAELDKNNYEKAVELFGNAVTTDPQFVFAWDNLGLSYRRLNNYDKAIEAYQTSLQLDPGGVTPLQNIAVAYQYKKEYQKAIDAYEKLAQIDNTNPEVYYGLGLVYAQYQNNFEKGLDNLCKAYNLYVKQKSPYRTDAEKMIQMVFAEMKKQGKEEKFNEILKQNNISPK